MKIEKTFRKSIFSSFSELQTSIYNLAIQISSAFFVSWFLITTLLRKENIFLTFMLFFIFNAFCDKRLRPKFKKFSYYSEKTILILGSLLVLFLYLNSYLILSDFLSRYFLNIWDWFEEILNQVIFAAMFMIILFFIYLCLAFLFFKFILNLVKKIKAGRIGTFFKFIAYGLILLIIIIFLYFVFKTNLFYLLIKFAYPQLNWFIGFSLVFLHLSYLIKEIKRKLLPNVLVLGILWVILGPKFN